MCPGFKCIQDLIHFYILKEHMIIFKFSITMALKQYFHVFYPYTVGTLLKWYILPCLNYADFAFSMYLLSSTPIFKAFSVAGVPLIPCMEYYSAFKVSLPVSTSASSNFTTHIWVRAMFLNWKSGHATLLLSIPSMTSHTFWDKVQAPWFST